MPTLISRPAPELDRARLPGGTASRRARVLVLDGQTTQALACVRSLGRAGYDVLVASDCRWPLGAWSRHSRARFRVKGETVAAFAELRAWARRLGVSVVLPLTERSCLLCDTERAAWTEVGITVGCAPTDVLMQAFDKGRVIARAEACGVSIPPKQFPHSLAACHAAAEVVGFPCVVKARRSKVQTEMGFSRDPGPGYAASHAELDQTVQARRQGEHWPCATTAVWWPGSRTSGYATSSPRARAAACAVRPRRKPGCERPPSGC